MSVPESVDRGGVGVTPGLAALTVGEVAIGATGSDVHDQVEVLVEGGVDLLLVGPRVIAIGPLTTFPERHLRCVNVENNVVRGVEIGSDSILGPEETIDMEVVSEGLIRSELLSGLLITIGIPGGSPMQSGGELVVATSSARGVVTARLHDVDLTGCGPSAISLILGKHPNSGPEEVTLRKLCFDFDLSVLEVELAGGSDTSGLDWVDHVA